MDARGVTADMPTKGTRRSTLDELADWTLRADKIVSF
jgi:sulfur relay (sulfurtransferase) complex TusBCD TusD component (DsrE family)